MEHPIQSYLDEIDKSQTWFAGQLGKSVQLLNDVIRGRCYLGRETSLEVVRLTGGRVTLEQLATWTSESKAVA